MRPKRWIKANLLAMIAVGSVVAILNPLNPAAAADDANSIGHLIDTINSNNALITEREEAAVQLVNQNNPAANNAAAAIIRNFDNPRGQIAIAWGLAQANNPDPQFISDLGRLLGTNAATAEAAAKALANYDGHPEIYDLLLACAENRNIPGNIRAEAVSAMGSQVRQSVAAYLINVATAFNQIPTLQNAAMDALADMTGIRSIGANPGQWQQWWNGLSNKSPDQFRSEVLASRDRELRLLKLHNSQFTLAAGRDLKQNYNSLLSLDAKVATDVLLGYLNDRTPEIRTAGVDQINDIYYRPDLFVEPLRKKLLSMIGDFDASVRLHVAAVLLNVNDRTSVPAILDQLKAEKDLKVKAALAKVLGKLEDPSAIPALLEMLHDPEPEIVTAAAGALSGNLGASLRKTNPQQADLVSADLRHIIDTNTNIPGMEDLRAACVSALAALRDKQSFNTFMRLIQPAETSEVRQAALLGLGNLGDTHADSEIARQLEDNNDRRVRYRAAEALVTTAEPGIADDIFKYMTHDPDDAVRSMLWNAFQNLYPRESPDQLQRWADALKDDPDKHLVTLQKLGDADAAAQDDKGVAENQQVIADAMMAIKPPKMLDAIANLQKSLAYWRGPGKGDQDKLEAVIGALLDDQLQAGQYSEATQFAAQQIALDPEYQQTVGPKIKTAAETLSTTDPAAAKRLIEAALTMNPPLRSNYVNQLQDIQNGMK